MLMLEKIQDPAEIQTWALVNKHRAYYLLPDKGKDINRHARKAVLILEKIPRSSRDSNLAPLA